MKIVFTNKIYLPHIGGVEIYIHEIAQYLLSKGHEVVIITADVEADQLIHEKIDGEKIVRIPSRRVGGLYFLKHHSDYRAIEQELKDADIVHCNDCKFLYVFLAQHKYKFGYKLAITSHGWMFHTPDHLKFKEIYFKHVISRMSPYYAPIINVSEQDKGIAERYGIRHSIVIMNGVDYNKYSDITPKASLGNTFVYWGRISENKGILECLKKISTLPYDFKFNIAGVCEDEAYMDSLEKYISANNMQNKVNFLGRVSDQQIHDLIEEADFILMPSLHEGFGISLVEGLLANRPIIANTNESYCYILKETGCERYLFSFTDESTVLADKIEELKENRVEPQNYEQFSIDNMISRTETAIREA